MDNNTEQQVLITKEDIKNVKDFFSHFNIDIPSHLEAKLDDIANAESISIEHQKHLKTAIARTIVESEHEIFKDALFEEVIPNCEKEWYHAQFDQDFKEAMTQEDPSED